MSCVLLMQKFLFLLAAQGIFSFGGETATNMTFLFVLFQNLFYLCIQIRLDLFQPLADILMYGAFRDTEPFCCRTNRGFLPDDILAENHGTCFGLLFYDTSLQLWFCYSICGGTGNENGAGYKNVMQIFRKVYEKSLTYSGNCVTIRNSGIR